MNTPYILTQVYGLKGDELLKFESVQNWVNSLDQIAKNQGKKGISKTAKAMRLGRIWEYTNEGKLNPDELKKFESKTINLEKYIVCVHWTLKVKKCQKKCVHFLLKKTNTKA